MRPETEILLMIYKRVGAHNAITIDEILAALESLDLSGKHKNNARLVKQVVRDARRRGIKIGSTRGSIENPPGYYTIITADELAATVRPLMRQAVDQLRTIEALTGKGYVVRELAGQMKLFDAPKEPKEVVASQ